MRTSFIPLSEVISVLIIAFLFASLQQINNKTRYAVFYEIVILMPLATIPISEHMGKLP